MKNKENIYIFLKIDLKLNCFKLKFSNSILTLIDDLHENELGLMWFSTQNVIFCFKPWFYYKWLKGSCEIWNNHPWLRKCSIINLRVNKRMRWFCLWQRVDLGMARAAVVTRLWRCSHPVIFTVLLCIQENELIQPRFGVVSESRWQ